MAEEIEITTPVTPHGYRVFCLVRAAGITPGRPLILTPGERVSFTVCAAFGNAETERPEDVRKRLMCYFAGNKQLTGNIYLERQIEEYSHFYDAVPEFE